MIQLHDFSIGYGERTLLHEVEAAIPKGSLTALIGRNGTGKSTLLRAIAGLNRRYTGEILLDGRDISDMRADEMAKTLAFVTTERTRIANLKCEDVVGRRQVLPIPTGSDGCKMPTGRLWHGRSPRWECRIMLGEQWTRCRTASASAS